MDCIPIPDRALAKYVADLADDIEHHWEGSDCVDYLMAIVHDLNRNNETTNIWLDNEPEPS